MGVALGETTLLTAIAARVNRETRDGLVDYPMTLLGSGTKALLIDAMSRVDKMVMWFLRITVVCVFPLMMLSAMQRSRLPDKNRLHPEEVDSIVVVQGRHSITLDPKGRREVLDIIDEQELKPGRDLKGVEIRRYRLNVRYDDGKRAEFVVGDRSIAPVNYGDRRWFSRDSRLSDYLKNVFATMNSASDTDPIASGR